MPPKKRKTDKDSVLPSEYAAIPSKRDVINTDTEKKDPFSFPDVMMMDKPTLKSELNHLKVCIVGNPMKANLQEKLLAAYTVELMDKVANFYCNYQNCHYAILQKSKKKSVVSFQCTRYQVTAPGLGETPWENYKACEKFIDKINKESQKNVQLFDMKNHSRSCPGKKIVLIVNSTVGLPYFPPPFHLCGNVSHIQNMDLGQQDLHPSFQLISPRVLFKDVLSINKRQAIMDILDKKVLTGGCQRRFYVTDLASQPEVCKVVERVMKPLIDYVQAMYPPLVCVKLGALQTLPKCPSQYKGHSPRLHADYSSNYPEFAPAQRPVSVILALDPFDFMYLPHISQSRKVLVHLTVPSRVVSHLFTGSLAGIGKLPALAGWYIWYGMYGIFCTVRFCGSSFL
jgi:hypothetical protein